ncbi:hypothetical protein CAC42_3389 [Sphaceloma murrayae]|uniref:Macro domain-containing protein n=1 Tax=Sphaceloma murrayae TaxID=2082308 RepID=A0A2K1R180_9PEZI|nr:hypothetical protein CAC42_3389 [Sphaceloma murrayae]
MAVLSISDIPSITQLYKTAELAPVDTTPTPLRTNASPPRLSSFNSRVHLIKHDITQLRLTAIVNAANSSLLGGGGVDGAIHRAAGPGLLDECEKLDGCETGDAKATGGHKLPAKHVLHAVGPIYGVERRKKEGRQEELLAGCYKRCLELAKGLDGGDGGVSVGFSGLSTGVYGYPKQEAAKVAIATVLQWMVGEKERAQRDSGEEAVKHVVFVCFEQKDYDAYIKWLPQFCPPEEEGVQSGTTFDKAAQDSTVQGPTTDSTESTDLKLAGVKMNSGGDVTAHEKMNERLELPSPPTTEPKLPGQPDSKKVKTMHGESS